MVTARGERTAAGDRQDVHKSPERGAPELSSLEETIELHHGKWVLLRVTAYDDHLPARCEVVAAGPSHDKICRKLTAIVSATGSSHGLTTCSRPTLKSAPVPSSERRSRRLARPMRQIRGTVGESINIDSPASP